jgi:protein pelota
MRAQVFNAVMRHVDWNIVRCLVIAGPGFTKEEFRKYLDAEAVKRDVRYASVTSCRSCESHFKLSHVHCNGGYRVPCPLQV